MDNKQILCPCIFKRLFRREPTNLIWAVIRTDTRILVQMHNHSPLMRIQKPYTIGPTTSNNSTLTIAVNLIPYQILFNVSLGRKSTDLILDLHFVAEQFTTRFRADRPSNTTCRVENRVWHRSHGWLLTNFYNNRFFEEDLVRFIEWFWLTKFHFPFKASLSLANMGRSIIRLYSGDFPYADFTYVTISTSSSFVEWAMAL